METRRQHVGFGKVPGGHEPPIDIMGPQALGESSGLCEVFLCTRSWWRHVNNYSSARAAEISARYLLSSLRLAASGVAFQLRSNTKSDDGSAPAVVRGWTPDRRTPGTLGVLVVAPSSVAGACRLRGRSAWGSGGRPTYRAGSTCRQEPTGVQPGWRHHGSPHFFAGAADSI